MSMTRQAYAFRLCPAVIEEPKGVCSAQNCVLAFFRIANIKITLRIVHNDVDHLYNLRFRAIFWLMCWRYVAMDKWTPDDMVKRVKRYIDEYKWGWGITKQLVNRFYGTQYTTADVKKIYNGKMFKITT